MDNEQKTPRKRVANFTGHEKALLAQLIKKRPVVESKRTDNKAVEIKKKAWSAITQEFNSNDNVHKRETITLKRAWDNMKAFARKSRVNEPGNFLSPGDGPPPPPHIAAPIITLIEEAPPVICEIKNPFDSDTVVLDETGNERLIKREKHPSESVDTSLDTTQNQDSEESTSERHDAYIAVSSPDISNAENSTDCMDKDKTAKGRPSNYIHREAVLRIHYLKNKKNLEMKILRTQLEVEQIKKKAALLEEEKNKVLLEKALAELQEVKNNISTE